MFPDVSHGQCTDNQLICSNVFFDSKDVDFLSGNHLILSGLSVVTEDRLDQVQRDKPGAGRLAAGGVVCPYSLQLDIASGKLT